MNLLHAVEVGYIVQVVTDYAIERIGIVTDLYPDCIKLEPYNNKELRKLMQIPGAGLLQDTYNPSVLWSIVIDSESIKEIIILKNNG